MLDVFAREAETWRGKALWLLGMGLPVPYILTYVVRVADERRLAPLAALGAFGWATFWLLNVAIGNDVIATLMVQDAGAADVNLLLARIVDRLRLVAMIFSATYVAAACVFVWWARTSPNSD